MKIYISADTTSVSLGADDVAVAIQERLKNNQSNSTIVRNGSWGLFWLEPMIEVEIDNERHAYGPVSCEDIPTLFDLGFPKAFDHPLYLGKIASLPAIQKQTRMTFARCGLIDPASLDDYSSYQGFVGLKKALSLSSTEIIDQIEKSNLRGRGGAGFPTGIKWRTVNNTKSDKKYIVCNADEGDSGTFADRMLMEGDPCVLLEGMIIAGLAVGADQGYIYLRSEYPLANKVLSKAIDELYKANYLGENIQGSGKNFDLEIRLGAGAYICGEETALLESLEGKRGIIRPKPPLPAIEGLFGKPTVINNVITLATVPAILAQGYEQYNQHGVGRSRGTLTVQLGGNIKHGGLFEVPFGMTLGEVIYDLGGGSFSGKNIKSVQVGGPLGAYLPPSKFDLPLDYETFAKEQAMVGHGGIVVFDESVDMSEQAKFSMEFCSIESCGKCTPCRIGSTRGKEVIQLIQDQKNPEKNTVLLIELCDTMLHGSLCAMGGLTPYPVLSALKYFPEDFGKI